MVERGVIDYFNLPKKYFSKRGSTVDLIEKMEEKWFMKNMKVKKSDKILDFACGSGRWSKKLHNKAQKIIAIDISPKPLSSLKKLKIISIKTILGSDERLSQFRKYFDKIIFAQGLEFYKNPLNLLKKFKNSLKNKGELYLSTWTPILIKNFKGVQFKENYVIVKRPTDKKNIEVFCKLRNRKQVKKLLKRAGFKKIEIKVLSIKNKSIPRNVKKMISINLKGRGLLIVSKSIK